ncbi:hypothetical protein M2145_000482 [Lachnospiraceae bacterium PF1-21]|uniref:CDP-Glycerol:Poly(Glycerophosphate) glycerophosphotransferase n=1 Tax=Ohessyouella blattaphilus TaxID=2949333 RepID=A0ABT1EEH9_9FIRM|nr:hypothetical protein [Ohessyouella blattaphilus]MCP1109100.1 hypothetical protein [Ohessyouella blattaphilus]MCR8562494.1 hypothetical protein [Ohessyouella blattaphilus]MDL2250305.1 hypothetical protein [Lachnospiraceae bacterium OttesenSCG-928-J05]
MRRHQQKQLLELCQTLKEAYEELVRLFEAKQIDDSMINLLADCQNFAIKMGEYIESICGEGTQTVALLIECCEAIYQFSQEPSKTILKAIRKQLIGIENSIRSELQPNHMEVLFLPYKVSMADSLQTIWEASMANPQCETYVCPIPYYDKQPDGSLGQMHYEGDLYTDVKITDWQEYDIQSRHPDIIFIHSPYDDGNRVTSIHPDYYSEKLKDYTDLLVYVPYFVTVGDVAKHFCVTKGTVYADKVFVQSERVRETYVREFTEFVNENNYGEAFGVPEDKFIALGSPKFDILENIDFKNKPLPSSWQQLIKGTGNRNKKIVLYNTSVGAHLKGGERYLKKLRSVIELFNKREDVVLWWRPHPLTGETYKSMLPDLYDEYQEIVTEYCQEKRGIYDDTPDSYRAILWSDAYYGDHSAVVSLYGLTGKFIMYQDVNLVSDQKTYSFEEFLERSANHYRESAVHEDDLTIVSEDSTSCLNGLLDYLVLPTYSQTYQFFADKKKELFSLIAVFPKPSCGSTILERCMEG